MVSSSIALKQDSRCLPDLRRPPLFLLLLLLYLPLLYPAPAAANSVWLLEINGAIGPASADFVERGLHSASADQAQLLILQMDTPGGLDSAMRQIVKAILDADIPVVSYVAPEGARAASAGTYILYASHIAAMAPATNLGAATPVQIAGPAMPGGNKGQKEGDEEGGKTPSASAMERKIVNDAEAYIDGLAKLRQRNSQWAKKAVREAASLTATEALKQRVIEIVASDVEDLLRQLHGRSVTIEQKTFQLDTAAATLVRHQPDWRNRFLSVITNPSIAYVLMLIGIYGLIFEFSNPGVGLPGVVGSVCLLLALYALQMLPVSYAGLGLIALGCALMAAEAFAPSFGVLGIGGVIAFVLGSIMLMDTELPAFQIALPVILAVTSASAALLVLLLGMLLRTREQLLVSGLSTLVGGAARVETLHHGQPMVRLEGELWRVNCDTQLAVGDPVRITAARGVALDAQAVAPSAQAPTPTPTPVQPMPTETKQPGEEP